MKRCLYAAGLLWALTVVAVVVPVTAGAAGGNPILAECTSGQLSPGYTIKQLRHALAIMPASQRQYTSCVDVIQAAIITARRHGGRTPPPGSSGGSFLPVPVIVILAVVVVAALVFGGLALRRRGSPPPDAPADPPADGAAGPPGDGPADAPPEDRGE